MAITRWDPFREIMQMNERMNRLYGTARGSDLDQSGELTAGDWIPPCDVIETGDSIIVRAEIPGLKEEDIDIRLEGNLLSLRGHREFQKESEERNYHRIERSYGGFARSFTLPSGVDAENIAADYENGVLEVTLPKREESRPRQIKVGAAAGRQAPKSMDTPGRVISKSEVEREKPRR
ncbi:MAG TPA: Hsp20/alpha crystallin family protein [Thermoanaerobaculia bacterium]